MTSRYDFNVAMTVDVESHRLQTCLTVCRGRRSQPWVMRTLGIRCRWPSHAVSKTHQHRWTSVGNTLGLFTFHVSLAYHQLSIRMPPYDGHKQAACHLAPSPSPLTSLAMPQLYILPLSESPAADPHRLCATAHIENSLAKDDNMSRAKPVMQSKCHIWQAGQRQSQCICKVGQQTLALGVMRRHRLEFGVIGGELLFELD